MSNLNIDKAHALIVFLTTNEKQSNENFQTLYILISNFPKKDIISLINDHHLLMIFSVLNWNDSECRNIGLSLANLILSSLSWNDISNLPETDAILLLDPRNVVCSSFLSQVSSCLSIEADSVDPQTIPENMIKCIFQLVSHDNLEISTNAQNVIKAIAQMKPNGSDVLFGNQDRLTDIKQSFKSPESKLRLCELAIQVARQNRPSFEIVSNSGLFDELINFALIDGDVLVQINALEIMKDFIELDSGFQFLQDKNIIHTLDQKMNTLFDQPFGELLFPGFITLFGRIAHLHPREMLCNTTRFKEFLSKSLSVFSGLTADKLIVLETFAHIASTVKGKLAIHELVGNSTMNSVMSNLGEYLTQSPNEYRSRSLDAMRHFIDVPNCSMSADICVIVEHWFSQIRGSSSRTMDSLMSFVRLPFIEIRIAALRVIKSMVNQRWGLELCIHFGGFSEYMLDRRTEQEKECKEEKYAIVVRMVNSPLSSEIFSGPLLLNFKQFVSEGPLFVRPQAEVAIGGAD